LLERRVLDVIVRERRLRWPIAANLEAAIRGQTVRAIDRRAKYILIRFDAGTLILHLGMSGSLRLVKAETPPRTHDHWDMRMQGGWVLRFHDPRRFGSLHYTSGDPRLHPLLANLAPEPFDAAFDADYLWRVTRRRRVAIKQLLMNSRLVVGVGNIYANEALFRAKVRPRRQARGLSRSEVARLTRAVRAVLTQAIRVGGTTLRDYVGADGSPGYFRQKLYVYERTGQACRTCGTPVRQLTQGQRSTYYCPSCQK